MESLARPFHRRKLSNASSSFSAKTAYDDVFSAAGGAQKSGAPADSSRIEDYSEVFGGSRTSSIPILDLSAIDEAKVSVDARSSKLDYSKIFGGVRDGDIAVSYQEMFSKTKGAKNFSDGARAPAKTFSHTDGSGRLNRYKEEAFQNEAPNQTFEGVKQFNMSYHKTSQRSDDGTNGATRIAQLRAVPAFTCFIGEDNPIRKTEGDKSIPPPKVDVTSPPKVSAYVTKKQTSDGISKFGSQASGDRFCPIDKSFSANEPSTHPSKMASPSTVPANLTSDNSRPKRSTDPNFKVPKNDVSKVGPGYWSPSLSDEELDVNSAAAASAAALRKALEKAQASIRIAKEFMERKKDGPQRFSKPSSMDGLDFKNRREDKVTREASRMTEKNSKEINESADIVFQVFTKSERDKARRSGKVAPDLKVREEIPIVKELSRETKGNKLESTQDCEEPRLISELASRATCSTATLAFEHANGTNNVMLPVDSHECGRKEMEIGEEILEQLQGNGKKADEEAQTLEDLEGKLDKSKTIPEWEQHGYRVDTAQGVHEQEQNEKARVVPEDEETEEEQKTSIARGKCEQELEDSLRPNENEEFESLGVNSNIKEEGLHEAQDCMENAGNLEEIFEKEENKNSLEDDHEEESEKKIQRICEQVEIQNRLQESYLSVDYEEACEAENIEKRQNDAHEGDDNEKSLDRIHEPEIDIERLNSPEGRQEESEERQEDNSAWEGKEKILGEPCEYAETEIIQRETEGNEKTEVNQEAVEETIYLDATSCEYVDTESIQKETEGSEKKEVNKEAVEEAIYLDATSNSCKWDADESVSEMEEGHPHKQNDSDSIIEENERISDVTQSSCELKDDEDGLEAVEVALEVGEKERCSSGGSVAGVAEHIEIEKQMKDESDSTIEEHITQLSCEFKEDEDGLEAVEAAHEVGEKERCASGGSVAGVAEHIEIESQMKEESDSIIEEHERISDVTQSSCEFNEDDEGLEAVEAALEVGEKERCSSGGSVAGVAEHIEIENQMKDESDSTIEEHERISDVTQSSCEFDEDEDGLEAVEAAHEVGEKERCSSCECKEDEDGLEAVEAAHEVGEKERCSSGGSVSGVAEHIEIKNQMKDGSEALHLDDNPANISFTGTSDGPRQTDQNEKESELISNLGSGIKISVCESEEGEKEVDEKIVSHPEEVKSNFDTPHKRRQWFETRMEMEPSQPPMFGAARKRRQWFETGKEMDPSPPPSMFTGEEKMTRIDDEIKKRQIAEKNMENLNKTFSVEEMETKETEQKEVKTEKELLRKNDEANKRERERERDRMAVERAIREARERAFAEARERAERAAVEKATADARKRVTAEGREKLAKASVATKSSGEKVSQEAKLRAERAAVERATAEARERALEKALSQKATSGAREQSERYVAEKSSGVSRDNGMRQSFPSSGTQKLDETNGESAERHKAMLERHQRTMERAAKALAEKNRRDLLIQKEQAERNRFAETLDADVKRWSSGKEGNLRALLSTLQYVLGPNSGWQPVSLTDIVTTTAVKKAYRKATLHVHPDKLQQRGATIQQKYICEKVFDLLKAAWNRFNSEER